MEVEVEAKGGQGGVRAIASNCTHIYVANIHIYIYYSLFLHSDIKKNQDGKCKSNSTRLQRFNTGRTCEQHARRCIDASHRNLALHRNKRRVDVPGTSAQRRSSTTAGQAPMPPPQELRGGAGGGGETSGGRVRSPQAAWGRPPQTPPLPFPFPPA